MRKISRAATILILVPVLGALDSPRAIAEDVYYLNQSQTGFTLPGVTLPQGQDEVRAADGTTCRSAVSGSGAYVDIGVVRGNSEDDQLATYGRVVFPLGRTPKRLDCARLYELEVQRLQLELKLLKMGLGPDGGAAKVAGGTNADWANEGWTSAPSPKQR